MASQITSLTIVYSTVYSGADQRKHQSSAPLALVRGIHRSPVNSPHKGPVTRKMFPFDDVIMRATEPGKCLANQVDTMAADEQGPVSIWRPSYLRMAISMLKIRRPLGRLIFNMGIAIPGKTVFLIETAPWFLASASHQQPWCRFCRVMSLCLPLGRFSTT